MIGVDSFNSENKIGKPIVGRKLVCMKKFVIVWVVYDVEVFSI